jgi:hypothetical protein
MAVNVNSSPPEERRSRTTRVRLWHPLLVGAGIAFTLCCVVLICLWARGIASNGWSVIAWTVVLAGAPILFLSIRLDTYLRAHRQGEHSRFWPQDGSTAANWGLVLVMLNMGAAFSVAFVTFDGLVFDGQISQFLAHLDH